jgi:hypothetical protein
MEDVRISLCIEIISLLGFTDYISNCIMAFNMRFHFSFYKYTFAMMLRWDVHSSSGEGAEEKPTQKNAAFMRGKHLREG